MAGAARTAGRGAAAAAAASQLFSLSDDGVMSLASLGGLGDSLAATAAEVSQLQGEGVVLAVAEASRMWLTVPAEAEHTWNYGCRWLTRSSSSIIGSAGCTKPGKLLQASL